MLHSAGPQLEKSEIREQLSFPWRNVSRNDRLTSEKRPYKDAGAKSLLGKVFIKKYVAYCGPT